MKFTQFKWLVTMLLLVTAMAMPASTWAKSNITPSKPSGDGSENSPYEISNAAELYWFAGLINGTLEGETQNKSANAVLTANIIVNTGVLKSDGTLADNYSGFITWTPMGNYQNPFTGTFDGKGHTISGLYFNESTTFYVGLFGYINGTIKNVGVVDSGRDREQVRVPDSCNAATCFSMVHCPVSCPSWFILLFLPSPLATRG